MTYATAISIIFLVVSLLNLAFQWVSLGCLTCHSMRGAVEKRLLHTVACRVVAALTYVGLAVSALIRPPATGTIALTVSSAMLIMWWINSAADVRLRRRLDSAEQLMHRAGRAAASSQSVVHQQVPADGASSPAEEHHLGHAVQPGHQLLDPAGTVAELHGCVRAGEATCHRHHRADRVLGDATAPPGLGSG